MSAVATVTDRRYITKKMSLLTELEILDAGFLQRWRAYGAAEYPEGFRHSAQPQRGYSLQPSVAVTKERLRWVKAHNIYQL